MPRVLRKRASKLGNVFSKVRELARVTPRQGRSSQIQLCILHISPLFQIKLEIPPQFLFIFTFLISLLLHINLNTYWTPLDTR